MDEVLGAIAGIMVIIVVLVFCSVIYDYGYKQGQIDAINGKIKYHLVVTDDKTSRWVLIRK